MLFEDEPYYKIIQVIAGIHIRTKRYVERRIRKINMTYAQLGLLMALVRKDNITQREMADLMESDTTTIMVICDSLQKKGWLERKPDRQDRRVNRLVLTDSGKDACGKAMGIIQNGYEKLFSKTSPEEINKILPYLEAMYGNITELLKGEVNNEA